MQHHTPLQRILGLVLLVIVAGAVPACGGDERAATTGGSTAATATSSAPSTTATPTTTSPPTTGASPTAATATTSGATSTAAASAAVADGSGCTPGDGDLPDGSWFGFVTSSSTSAIEFDLACWFTGDAAAISATEDGAESPPPNDYHVRNDNPAVRTVTVAPTAEVTWLPSPGDISSQRTDDYPTWLGESNDREFAPGVWLTVDGGSVTAIQEQYQP